MTTFGQAGAGLFVAPDRPRKRGHAAIRCDGRGTTGRGPRALLRHFCRKALETPGGGRYFRSRQRDAGHDSQEVAWQHLRLLSVESWHDSLACRLGVLWRRVSVGAQTAPGPIGPLHRIHAAQRPQRDPASRRQRAGGRGEHLVSRRLGQRAARAAPASRIFRARDVRRLDARARRRVRQLARGRRRQQQRLDDRRIGRTTTMDSPANALDLALFLESDRMGFLLDDKAPDKINGQRDVVKNEKRQSVDNQPYGQAFIETGDDALSARAIPTAGPVIGSMEDLTAASFEDVARFFKHLLRAQQRQPRDRRRHRRRQHAKAASRNGSATCRPASPCRRSSSPTPVLDGVKKKTITDKVQLPRLYLAWHTPALLKPGDADDGHGVEPADRRQEFAALQAGWSTTCRSRRTSMRSSSRRRSAAAS